MAISDQIQARALQATGKTMLTWDQWNFFLTEVTGSPGPAPEQFGIQRAADLSLPPISFMEWWQHVGPLLGLDATAAARPPAGGAPTPSGGPAQIPGADALTTELFKLGDTSIQAWHLLIVLGVIIALK